MTKKDYVLIASALSKLRSSKDKTALICTLTIVFAKDNPRFSAVEFINACVYRKEE